MPTDASHHVRFDLSRPLPELADLAQSLPVGTVFRRTGPSPGKYNKRHGLRKPQAHNPPTRALLITALTALKAAKVAPFNIATQAGLLACAQERSSFAAGKPRYIYDAPAAAA